MPSPFPGLDPYLEAPALWPDVHHWLISSIAAQLNRQLPAPYVARINERIYLAEPARPVIPDVSVRMRQSSETGVKTGAGQGGVATLTSPTEPWQIEAPELEEISEAFIQIMTIRPERRLVTAIELLSPSNKALGSPGRTSYLRKQRELAEEGVALLELDFLRGGEHTVEAPLEQLLGFGRWDYLACLHRAGRKRAWEVWSIPLREPLPTIRVPLGAGEEDVLLSLQPVFDQAYDLGAYALDVDYQRDPEPPLNEADTAWARELLRPLREGTEAA